MFASKEEDEFVCNIVSKAYTLICMYNNIDYGPPHSQMMPMQLATV